MAPLARLARSLPLAALALLLLTGCQSVFQRALAPGSLYAPLPLKSAGKGSAAPKLSATELQILLMEFSDSYMEGVGYAADGLVQSATEPRERAFVQAAKVFYITSASSIAADPDPLKALVDMMVLLSLQCSTWDLPQLRAQYGARADALRVQLEVFDRAIWDLGAQVFPQEALDILRGLISEWRAKHPEQTYVAYVRFLHLPSSQAKSRLQGMLQHKLLLSSVSEAARSVDDARRTTERALFVSERFPALLVWQMQLAYLDLVAEPEVQKTLGMADQFTSNSAAFVRAIEALPGQVRDERRELLLEFADVLGQQRQEALDAFAGTLDQQRTALFAELDAHIGNYEGTLSQAGQTLAQAQGVLTKFDETAGRIEPLLQATQHIGETYQQLLASMNELATGLRPAAGEADADFDADEARALLREIQTTAESLNAVLVNLNAAMGDPAAPRRLGALEQAARAQIDYVFYRALILIGVLLVGLAIVLTLVRRLDRRP